MCFSFKKKNLRASGFPFFVLGEALFLDVLFSRRNRCTEGVFADFLEADFAECSVKSGLPGKPAIKDSFLQVEDIAPKPSRLLLCHGCVVICPCA